MTAATVDERSQLPGPTWPPSAPTFLPLTERRPVVLADDPCEAGLPASDPEYAGIYLHARYFDPKLGIFLSPDPIGVEGGMNQYGYGFGDPINSADRSGLTTREHDPWDSVDGCMPDREMAGQCGPYSSPWSQTILRWGLKIFFDGYPGRGPRGGPGRWPGGGETPPPAPIVIGPPVIIKAPTPSPRRGGSLSLPGQGGGCASEGQSWWSTQCAVVCSTPMPTVPLHPSTSNLDADIVTTSGRYNPAWYFGMIRPGGAWDHKLKDPSRNPRTQSIYEEYGNFAFGTTSGAFGMPLVIAQAGAGWVQQTSDQPVGRNPWLKRAIALRAVFMPSFGDNSGDQAVIADGRQYYHEFVARSLCGCAP